MTDHIIEFFSFLSQRGLTPANPAQIVADDKLRRYEIVGDKKGSKNGSFQLKVEPDFAVGWARSFKEGITYKFTSRSNRELSAEEKAEFKKKIEAEKKRKEREQKKLREQAAAKAVAIWGKAVKDGSTPYLERKQAVLNGARIWRSLVVVPAYYDGKVVSLQFISADGTKQFIKHGQIEGAYFPIAAAEDDKSLLIICEGFATGDAIRKATGLPVIVAFNAGNLKPVAEVMRQKYPASRFMIAADNDAFTVHPKTKEPWNPGIEWARKAAIAIGGAAVIWPEFPNNNETRFTDFNDALLHLGAEYVKERILAAIPKISPEMDGGDIHNSHGNMGLQHPAAPDIEPWLSEEIPLEAYDQETREIVSLYTTPDDAPKDNSWREHLAYNDKGKLMAKSLNNAKLFLQNDNVLSHLFCFDDFAKEKIVYKCPPWEDVATFKPHPLNDTDITFLTCELEKRGVIQQTGTVAKMVSAVIKNRARNPAREYFDRLVWDKQPRLDKWLAYYCGAEFDNPEYVSIVGRKWLVAAVARVFEPGTKFDHMLVLEGKQNAGKSWVLKELATIHGTAYFDDTIKVSDLGTAAVVPKLQGVLIVEIAEMAGLGKKDVNELKAEITITHDRLVRKYENEPTRYPRQFVFAGTINPVDGYLDDPTGNRRFWPVRVGDKIDMESLKRDKEQLWAEAVARFKEGEQLYLNPELYDIAVMAQRERNVVHPWYPDIELLTRERDSIPVKEVWENLGIHDKTKRTAYAARDISKIMTALGFENRGENDKALRQRIDGKPQYIWRRKELKQPLLNEEVLFG